MTQVIINLGVSPNTQTGDTVRLAFDKVNQNFTELYAAVGPSIIPTQTENYGKILSTDGTNLGWIPNGLSQLTNGSHVVSLDNQGMLTVENLTGVNLNSVTVNTLQINATESQNDFILQKNGNNWSFDIAGNITLPPGGIIKNSDGSPYAGTSGSGGFSLLIDGGSPSSVFDGSEVTVDGGSP